MKINIIFWQPIKSPHIIYLASELCKFDINVFYIVLNKKEDSHKNLGWEINENKINRILYIDNENEINDKIFNENSIHITSGKNKSIIPYKYIKKIKSSLSPWVFMCEKFQTNDIFSIVRYLKYFYILNICREKPDYFFSISDDAYSFLKKIFIKKSKIFPFAYFIENNFKNVNYTKSNIVRILFVGNLIKRKNVKLILESLVKLNYSNFIFEIVGNGNELDYLTKYVFNNPLLNGKVLFLGNKNINDIHLHFENKDILILPSKFDGWGVVATESFMAGVPILVSNNCGSKDLVNISKVGYVFKSKIDFTKFLEKIFISKNSDFERSNIKNIGDKFSSIQGAKYLYDIIVYLKLKQNRPRPPWNQI